MHAVAQRVKRETGAILSIALLSATTMPALPETAMADEAWFRPATFVAGTDCRWKPAEPLGIRMNAHYVAPPTPDQSRDAWLEAVRRYRTMVREGGVPQVVDLNYRGVRAWIRLETSLAKAMALRPGEPLRVSVEACWLAGNTDLCVAFDRHSRRDDAKTGWTGVQGTLSLTPDRKWHRTECAVAVPEFDPEGEWLRPILGMDATHNPRHAHIEIRDVRLVAPDAKRSDAFAGALAALPNAQGGLDRAIYDRTDLAWAARAFTCHFTFMYDRGFYDPQAGAYILDAFLEDGQQEFGGYDILVLWQAYPRLGVDERNQFDMYRDMPGGLARLRDLIGRAHERGVKVFIDYNPWDRGTRREGRPDEEVLADLVKTIDADGIFLDTMSAGSLTLRKRLDAAKPGVVLAPEGHPSIDQLSMLSASWAQWLAEPHPPGLLRLKWIEPRHMQHQIHRWDTSHRAELESAFFNGSGMLVWENIFGTYNPWSAEDRRVWRRAVGILRHFAGHVTSDRWDPYYPTLREGLFANRWPGDGATLFTLVNRGEPIREDPLLELPADKDAHYFDLWRGQALRSVETAGGKVRLIGSIDRLGCVAGVARTKNDPAFERLLARQRELATARPDEKDPRNAARSVVDPDPADPTPARFARTGVQCGTAAPGRELSNCPAEGGWATTSGAPQHVSNSYKRLTISRGDPPPGMVFVPGGKVHMKIEHLRRECGCYPDPGTPPERWKDFLWGHPFQETLRHDYTVEVGPFFIDEAEVTNVEYERFLDATGYRPKVTHNFLRHWPGGGPSPGLADNPELADLPVVYVDLEDARAYARWAGKRLPTEAEWHLAAQGTDGRTWPWGNAFDPTRCNTTGTHPLPVRSCPDGRSPFGCYHMAGNVWEWTESVRDDGHTRFAILRGGSYFEAKGSGWYVPGGPRPCTHHAKFLLMWPGLDRCSTIGFRCVVDAEE